MHTRQELTQPDKCPDVQHLLCTTCQAAAAVQPRYFAALKTKSCSCEEGEEGGDKSMLHGLLLPRLRDWCSWHADHLPLPATE